jgi:hypothetical protein
MYVFADPGEGLEASGLDKERLAKAQCHEFVRDDLMGLRRTGRALFSLLLYKKAHRTKARKWVEGRICD